jgi:5-methylcytosine-specific restriction endonuclease McrA
MVFNTEIKRDGKNAEEMYCKLNDLQVDVKIVLWYIESYLCTEYTDKEKAYNDLDLHDHLEHMERWHSDNIAEYIKAMEYKDFLQTPYWKNISEYKKKLANNRCQLCNRGGELHTHHRTYSIHGYEIKNLDDLVVLCKKCHAKFHNKGGVV